MGGRTARWSHLPDIVSHSVGAVACFFVDSGHNKKYSVGHPITLSRKMYYQYNESVHRKEQHATIINTISYKMLVLFTFTFARRRIRPPNA